jgi:endonuclease-3
MNHEKINAIFSILNKKNLNPTTELKFHSSFELLIAVILSAQTTDIGVNKVTNVLFKKANTAKKLSQLPVNKIENLIKTIGLYRNKAKNIKATSLILDKKYNGVIPDDREILESLPGVGRKTANVILNTIFKKPVIAVDTHIFRLANRLNIGPGKTPLAVEKKLTKLIPQKYLVNAHHLLILHGRYTCKASNPDCLNCSIKKFCEYKYKIKETKK